MRIAKKGTLLVTSGPAKDPDRKHLHVVCSDPDEDGNVVIVSICSVREENKDTHDQTCVLHDFEHAFLRHQSFVFYREAKIRTTTVLELGVAQGDIIEHEDMAGQPFLKVVKGLCRSPHTPRKVKNFMGCEAEKEPELVAA